MAISGFNGAIIGADIVKNTKANAKNNTTAATGAKKYYSDLLDSYNSAQTAATPDYSGATDYLKSSADSQKEILQNQYDAGARNAYVNYMQAKRDLPQQMGAVGLGGTGLAESSLVGLNADYGKNLSTLRGNLANGISSINSDVASKIYSSMLNQADAQAAANSNAASAYAKLLAGYDGGGDTAGGSGYTTGGTTGGYTSPKAESPKVGTNKVTTPYQTYVVPTLPVNALSRANGLTISQIAGNAQILASQGKIKEANDLLKRIGY